MDNKSDHQKPSPLADWKNMDPAQFLQLLLSHKGILLQVVIVAGGLVLGFGAFGQFMREKSAIESQMGLLRSKVATIETWRQSEAQQKQYVGALPQAMESDALVGYLSELANRHQVVIASFTPVRSQEDDNYDVAALDIACSANSFKAVVLFLQAIEEDVHALRVQDLKISHQADKGVDLRVQIVSSKIKSK